MPTEPAFCTRQPLARLATAAAVLSMVLAGSGPRTPQIEFGNRRYSAALRTAANTKNAARLARAKEHIERDHAAGIIGLEEYGCYADIIALAEAGRWQEAERKALSFRRAQRR
jgi:hypothetical protein